MKKIALVGNPNCGKTSIFNILTGLKQKVGNYPGVTVEKKTGTFSAQGESYLLEDLPGLYSLHPSSPDEEITTRSLLEETPHVIMIVGDATTMKRNLLLITQAIDLGIPSMLVLTMADVAEKEGIVIDTDRMEELLGIPVVLMNARQSDSLLWLKNTIKQAKIGNIRISSCGNQETYREFLLNSLNHQHEETRKAKSLEVLDRYKIIAGLIKKIEKHQEVTRRIKSSTLDRWILHPFGGYVIFILIFFLQFQLIFSISSYPMDWIETGFSIISDKIGDFLPATWWSDLITHGLLSGIGGVVVFVPQIALLFFFLSILEESGYMARVSFLLDRTLRRFGLNGKSIVPLSSGMACAVPAIMSTRNIGSWKERIITILVTPLMSCSARLPVYTVLIGLFTQTEDQSWWIFDYRGMMLTLFYLLGIVASLFMAWVFHFFISDRSISFFILELPIFQKPRWKNVFQNVFDKSMSFVGGAGKVILLISLILWVLQSFGPSDRFKELQNLQAKNESHALQISREKLELSYAGQLGKAIEPVIQPLGFDWKIGISLITSFAAREVFVGTMSTIYALEESENSEKSLTEQLRNEVNPKTGKRVYSEATVWSLLIFYAFAMQCMSTLAVTKKETNSWKWPLIQLGYLTALAYLSSLLVYQWLA